MIEDYHLETESKETYLVYHKKETEKKTKGPVHQITNIFLNSIQNNLFPCI